MLAIQFQLMATTSVTILSDEKKLRLRAKSSLLTTSCGETIDFAESSQNCNKYPAQQKQGFEASKTYSTAENDVISKISKKSETDIPKKTAPNLMNVPNSSAAVNFIRSNENLINKVEILDKKMVPNKHRR